MDDQMKTASMIARLFCYAFDQDRARLKESLDQDAVLDWFGRTIRGNKEIVTFLETQFPLTQHYVFSAKACDPVEHRTKSNCKRNLTASDDCRPSKFMKLSESATEDGVNTTRIINILAGFDSVPPEEYPRIGSNVLKNTPTHHENSVEIPNFEPIHTREDNIKAIVIVANLYLSSKRSKMTPTFWERKLKQIVVEFDKTIKLIVYEGATTCRKNLSLQFDNLDPK